MRREAALALSALLLGTLGAWGYPYLVPGAIGFDGDSLFLFFPALEFVREEIFSGRLPLWNPYKFLGSPLLADLMVPRFYPPQFLALLPPQPFGQHFGIVCHALWSAGGVWVVTRRGFGVSAFAGLFGGWVYSLCASMQVHASHPNQFYSMAWLPWVLAAVLETLRGERRWLAALSLGLVLGMQGLAGQPQIVTYSAVIVLVSMAWSSLKSPRDFNGRWLPLAAAAAIALGLSAIHLLPAFELSRYSVREIRGLDFAQSYSLPFANLRTLLLPGALGGPGLGGYRGDWNFTETAIFAGQPALALALAGGIAARRRSEVWFIAGGMSVIGLLWALGESTPAYAYVLKAFPPLAQFRAPSRAFILVVLAISIFSALGVDAVSSWLSGVNPSIQRKRLVLGLGILILGLQAATLMDFRFRILRSPLTFLSDAVVTGWEQRLAGLAGGEGRLFRLMTEIDYMDDSRESVQVKFARLQPDINVLHRISVLGGYEEGMLPNRDYVFFMRENLRRIYSPKPDTELMGLMGIRYILADKPVGGPGLRFLQVREGVGLLENLDYRGIVFSRSDWPKLDWDRLDSGFFEFSGKDEVGEGAVFPKPRVRSRRVAAGKIHVEYEGLSDRRLIVSETWMPGWRLKTVQGDRIFGRRLAPFLIEFETPSESGSGDIEYRPLTFELGRGLTILTTVILLGGLLILDIRERRTREA